MTTKRCTLKGLRLVKILIDTNVILDVLCKRAEFLEHSSKVWKFCEEKRVDGYISALSVADIVYIMRRELNPQKTRYIIWQIADVFKIADLKTGDLENAADMCADDFEDAVQMCQADRLGADYIVTRNIRHYKDSKIPALTPAEFSEKFAVVQG